MRIELEIWKGAYPQGNFEVKYETSDETNAFMNIPLDNGNFLFAGKNLSSENIVKAREQYCQFGLSTSNKKEALDGFEVLLGLVREGKLYLVSFKKANMNNGRLPWSLTVYAKGAGSENIENIEGKGEEIRESLGRHWYPSIDKIIKSGNEVKLWKADNGMPLGNEVELERQSLQQNPEKSLKGDWNALKEKASNRFNRNARNKFEIVDRQYRKSQNENGNNRWAH